MSPMFKNLQTSFQRATVSSNSDELGISLDRLKGHVNDLRVTLREIVREADHLRADVDDLRKLRAEVADLRAEVAALRAARALGGEPRHAPIVVPDAVLQDIPMPAPVAQVQPPAASVAAPDAAPAAPTPGAAAPARAEEAPPTPVTLQSIAAAIADDAAGRTSAPVDAGPIIRVSADGVADWGAIDNPSARAKAAGLKLIIDQPECISCGTCVEQTDAVFVLPDDSKAVARKQEGPMDAIQDAIDACPVTCIHWTDAPDKFTPLNDENGVKVA